MFRLLLNCDDRLIQWAQQQLGTTFFSDALAIGWGGNDVIRAVAVYERWSSRDCCVHLISDRGRNWLSRKFLAAGFFFPFVVHGRERMTGLVPADNVEALRLNRHMGWRREGLLKEAGADGTDIVILGMLRRECRFLPSEHRGARHGN